MRKNSFESNDLCKIKNRFENYGYYGTSTHSNNIELMSDNSTYNKSTYNKNNTIRRKKEGKHTFIPIIITFTIFMSINSCLSKSGSACSTYMHTENG
jgi:hypothetical protein